MAPTLISGDRVIVNKITFGARIYKRYDFSAGAPIQSWRTIGWRKIKHNDVLIFNFPDGYHKNKIEFKINYVYCKRCIGLPGDTINIKNVIFLKNNKEQVGYLPNQKELSITPDSLICSNVLETPFGKSNINWTIKEFGPLYVPKKNAIINLDNMNFIFYQKIIEYESGEKLQLVDNNLVLGERIIKYYTIKNNYYFTCGDNYLNSGDSRYWGFVPEEFIIGVAQFILYSKDSESKKFVKKRTLKKIN